MYGIDRRLRLQQVVPQPSGERIHTFQLGVVGSGEGGTYETRVGHLHTRELRSSTGEKLGADKLDGSFDLGPTTAQLSRAGCA